MKSLAGARERRQQQEGHCEIEMQRQQLFNALAILCLIFRYLYQKYESQVKVKTPGTDAPRFPQKINKTEKGSEKEMCSVSERGGSLGKGKDRDGQY